MIKVQVTQYFLPNGRQEQRSFLIPKEHKTTFDELAASGCRLAVEQLNNGMMALYIEHPEGDFEVRLAQPSEESINESMNELLEVWNLDKFNAWLESVSYSDDLPDELKDKFI